MRLIDIVLEIRKDVQQLLAGGTGNGSVNAKLDSLMAGQTQILAAQDKLQATVNDIQLQLEAEAGSGPPVAATIVYMEEQMAAQKARAAGMDFTLLDNGSMLGTFTPTDAVGNQTTWPADAGTIAWSVSDPAIVVTPGPGQALTATLAPNPANVPPKLVTGVIPTAVGVLADGTTTITATGDPIDVVAGGPAGAKIVESSK